MPLKTLPRYSTEEIDKRSILFQIQNIFNFLLFYLMECAVLLLTMPILILIAITHYSPLKLMHQNENKTKGLVQIELV